MRRAKDNPVSGTEGRMGIVKNYIAGRYKGFFVICIGIFVVLVTIFLSISNQDIVLLENGKANNFGREYSLKQFIMLMWYPIVLMIFFGLAYVVVDFRKYEKRHRQLQNLMNNIDGTFDEVPDDVAGIEKMYADLIVHLYNSKNTEIARQNQIYRNMLEFVTIWTHQVKTPLTALQLEASELEDATRKQVCNRLFEIEQYADMILQYLRMESDSTDYVFKKYSIKSIVNQSVKYFARTFIDKGISVKVDIKDDVVVTTDEKWLVFILKQIISNALKYTEKGCITIDMPDKNSIRISDTGIGIAADDLPRIFERGYTGYNGRKDKKATGVGLFLVRNVMEKLGGSVEIQSKLSVGTKVIVNLTKA